MQHLPTIVEGSLSTCEYCSELFEATGNPWCSSCSNIGWSSYNEGFVPLAKQFLETYFDCHGDHYDTNMWTTPIEDCDKCEACRKSVLETSEIIDQRLGKLARDSASAEVVEESVKNILKGCACPCH